MIALDDRVEPARIAKRREHSRDLVDKLRQSARVRRSLDIAGIALDDEHTVGPRLRCGLRPRSKLERSVSGLTQNLRDAVVPILAGLLVITLV
jgi:hypothetical protein